MSKAATAEKPVEQTAAQPVLGEAALAHPTASFGITPNGAGGFTAAPAAAAGTNPPGAGQAKAEAPVKTVSQVLGEITWLMTQRPRHKPIPLGDLEWTVMLAILLRQFRIFYQGDRPVGVAIWALVDDIVAKRIDANDRRLSAVEWKSGPHLRIIDVVAPFGGEAEMRKQVGARSEN
jgi:cytolysin-activating lysine-acyltransferase